MIQKYFLLIIFNLFFIICFSQIKITGIIKDSLERPIEDAYVLLKSANDNILAYTFSIKNGIYTLEISNEVFNDSKKIQISRNDIYEIAKNLTPYSLQYNFIVTYKNTLETVVVYHKINPIKNNDTLKYDVEKYSSITDRSIIDVIKKLPGIVVTEEGEIFYNGNKIDKFLIHGDDFMTNQYKFATNAIKNQLISSIDIIRNHEDIEVKKDIIQSTKVALNLVLKNENNVKLQGKGMLEAGSPQLLSIQLSPMLLNAKIKSLSQIKYNNVGVNDSRMILNQQNFNSESEWKSLVESHHPFHLPIDSRNYLYNNSKSFATNWSYKFNNYSAIKTNINLYEDKINSIYNRMIQTIVSNDTIRYDDKNHGLYKPKSVETTIEFTKNKNNIFIKDNFSFIKSSSNIHEDIKYQSNPFKLRSHQMDQIFKNELTIIPKINKNSLLEIFWKFNNINNPQDLTIDTGLNKNILNNNIAYSGLKQHYAGMSTNHTIFLHYEKLHTPIFPNIRITYTNHSNFYQSSLYLLDNTNLHKSYAGDLGNHVKLKNKIFTVNPNWKFQHKNYSFFIATPFTMNSIKSEEKYYLLEDEVTKQWINPNLAISFRPHADREIQFSYKFNQSINNNVTAFQGLILNNYRNISNNIIGVQSISSNDYVLKIVENKSYKDFFSSLLLSHYVSENSNSISYELDNELQGIYFIDQKNSSYNTNLKLNISKSLIKIKTKFSFQYQGNINQMQRFINSKQYQSKNINNSYDLNIISFLNNRFTLEESFQYANFQFKVKDLQQMNQKNDRYDFKLKLGYSDKERLYFNTSIYTVKFNGNATQKNTASFWNCQLRYTIKKQNVDIEINGINLLNKKHLQIINIDNFYYTESFYQLRGRMVTLGITKIL